MKVVEQTHFLLPFKKLKNEKCIFNSVLITFKVRKTHSPFYFGFTVDPLTPNFKYSFCSFQDFFLSLTQWVQEATGKGAKLELEN